MDIRTFIEVPGEDIEAYARDRIELVMGRFTERIAHVDMHLAKSNTHDSDNDHLCTFDVKLVPRGTIHVSANNGTARSAVVKAAHRAETALAKAVDRGHRSRNVRHQGGGVRHLGEQLDMVNDSDEEE